MNWEEEPVSGGYILNLIVEILLGTSAVIVALRNIYSFFREPKKLVDRYIAEERESIMQEVHVQIEKVINEMLEKIKEETTEIKDMVSGQEESMKDMLGIDRKALRIILHREIERIYEAGLPSKTLTTKQRQHLHTLYDRYSDVEGNGYITNIMQEMSAWETID